MSGQAFGAQNDEYTQRNHSVVTKTAMSADNFKTMCNSTGIYRLSWEHYGVVPNVTQERISKEGSQQTFQSSLEG